VYCAAEARAAPRWKLTIYNPLQGGAVRIYPICALSALTVIGARVQKLNNTFAYSRDKEALLSGLLPMRLHGACISVMRELVLHANHSAGEIAGQAILRGECMASLTYLQHWTGLSEKTIRNTLKRLIALNAVQKKGAVQGADRTNLYVIVNYEDWDSFSKKGQTEGHTRGIQGATLKEDKEENTLERKEEAKAAAVQVHTDKQSPLALSNVELLAPDSTFDEEAIFSAWLKAKQAAKWQTRFTDAEARHTIYVLHCDPDASPRLSGEDVQHIMERWAAQRWPLKPAHLWHLNEKTGLPNYELHLHFSQNATNHQPKADTNGRPIYQTPTERRAAEREENLAAALAAID
jgi:hypothetical protein